MGIVCFILYRYDEIWVLFVLYCKGMTRYGYCLFYIVWYDELWVLFVLYYMV